MPTLGLGVFQTPPEETRAAVRSNRPASRRGLTRDDRRRRSHRQPDLRRPARREVVGDLHTRATGAEDQHPPRPEAIGVAVLGRVDQLPGEALAPIPTWDERLVLVAGRKHHLARRSRRPAGPRPHDPRPAGRNRQLLEVAVGVGCGEDGAEPAPSRAEPSLRHGATRRSERQEATREGGRTGPSRRGAAGLRS